MAAEPRLILDGLWFPEGPRWHEGRLWFSDFFAHEVVAVDLGGKRESIVRVPGQPSGLGWLPDGRLLVVSMTDLSLMRLDPDGLRRVADLSAHSRFRCNDMVVDSRGRAYVGNFGFDTHQGEPPRPTNLVLVTPGGEVRVAARDLLFPNGAVITPDGRTLVVAETYANRLTAFDIAPDGSLSGRRLWADVGAPPDGICLDEEGCIWVAIPRPPGRFLRVAEGGAIRARIDAGDRNGYACALGGPEGKTLFLLEAFTSRRNEMKGPGNGRIRAAEVAVPGAGSP